MKVDLSIKKAMYNDLAIIADAQNKTVSCIIREMLESKPCCDVIHKSAIVCQALQDPSLRVQLQFELEKLDKKEA